MSSTDDTLHLLLARADDHAPWLPEGIPASALRAPESPEAIAAPDDAAHGVGPDELDDVPTLGPVWGIIAPEGPEGDRLLALVEPLRKAREARQHVPAPVYRVPSGGRMTTLEALQWRGACYDGGADLGRARATHQLILGDLSQVPLAIQQVQTLDGYVGRLCFPDDAGYGAYVDKVLAAEAAPRRPGRLVFHNANDGSKAVTLARAAVTAPGLALLRDEIAAGRVPAGAVVVHDRASIPGLSVLLDRAAAPEPGVLVTLSHGLGTSMGGWRSAAVQRAEQGALCFGMADTLTGRDLAARAFMPAGFWLMFACFGAGTPAESVYRPWFDTLGPALGRSVPDFASTLSLGEPFIADLPQRALANPRGPLAVVGHVDFAWTYSFTVNEDVGRARPGRFMRVLAAVLEGRPVGEAFAELSRFVLAADAEIASSYGLAALRPELAADAAVARAQLWMTRHDLAGYILLGDPMARIAVGPAEHEFAMLAAAPAAPAAPQLAAGGPLERAIALVIAGDRPLADIARDSGLEPELLAARAAAYRAAGRAAIGL